MAIVTFWSENKKEIGQTKTSIAMATQMAAKHNLKVLLINTNNTNELDLAFWPVKKQKKGLASIFGNTNKVSIDTGIQGLEKATSSNRLTPELITNYTKIIFKNNRLEILDGYNGDEITYNNIYKVYPDVILNASMFYDIVIVDLNRKLNNEINKKILEESNIVVYGINQTISEIEQYINSKSQGFLKGKSNIVPYIGRYDEFTKYNSKNIARYIKHKVEIPYLSYNTLFREACEEGTVADFVLKLLQIKNVEDRNTEFLKEANTITENILYKVEEQKHKR